MQPNMLIIVMHMMSLGRVSGQVAADHSEPPYVCFTCSKRSIGKSLLTLLCQLKSFPPSPNFSVLPDSLNPSIFIQLSLAEGLRGLFSASFLTGYLAANSRSLVILEKCKPPLFNTVYTTIVWSQNFNKKQFQSLIL